ncbi:MAG: hypothetical protein GY708_03770 [Actinomycetia bacterium]|nr:hypothetical protein [Actinomycetes bacterium]
MAEGRINKPRFDSSTDIGGEWLIEIPDEDLRRHFAEPDFDDSGWTPVAVPGLWRNGEGLSDVDEVLYRTRFTAEPAGPGSRTWLSIDGLCYEGDIWLDGAYLGDTEGYFQPHVFEVTDAVDERNDHVLAIEASCRTPRDPTTKRNITGVLQHWDNLDPSLNPGGLWRRVRLEATGPVRIHTLRVTVVEADASVAILQFHAKLDSVATHTVVVRTLIDRSSTNDGVGAVASSQQEQVLATGANELEWRVAVESPDLWWPHDLGEQPLHDIRVEVELAGEISHARKRRIGVRSMELRNWIASINGERLFLKGTNLGPVKGDLSAQTEEDHSWVLDTAKSAGLNLIRVHGHVAPPEFYRQADAAGLLIWQDFPLQWGYARGIRKAAERQAEAMVDLLAHHPSIIIWCGHNEPIPLKARPGYRDDAQPANRFLRKGLWQHEKPSWNRTILDHAVKRAIQKADPSRPVIPHSGVLPHPPQLDGTDGHWYFGWFQGDIDGLKSLASRIPRVVRFVSEFGAQALPRLESLDLETLGDLHPDEIDWAELSERHGLHVDVALGRVPPSQFDTFGEWSEALRSYQAEVIRRQIETLRLVKYKPTGGFCQFHLVDSTPQISCSIFASNREAKPAVAALTRACQPVLAITDPLPPQIPPGVEQRQVIHIVSDLRDDIEARLDVTLRSSIEPRTWNFEGAVPADSVGRIAELRWTPPAAAGDIELELSVTADGVESVNTYRSTVRSLST